MASKNDKTTKTARVMNLLSKKPDSTVEEAASQAPEAPVPTSPAPHTSPTPPIVTSMAPDAAVSVQIKNALEDALAGETAPQQPVPEPEPAPVPEPVTAVQSEPAPAAQPEAEGAAKWDESHLPVYPGYMNVMQVLVEEKAPKYVRMFGLCSCERCMEDVKALTLNNLPPKYVVLERGDMVPRLTVYETKFSSDITAQLLQACKLVMERPHHGRE